MSTRRVTEVVYVKNEEKLSFTCSACRGEFVGRSRRRGYRELCDGCAATFDNNLEMLNND